MFKACAMGILFLVISIFGVLQINNATDMQPILENRLMLGDLCVESPCLFGQSLEGMDFGTTLQVLGNSNLRDDIILVEAPDRVIHWIWSDEFATQLNIVTSELQYNIIGFTDGEVHSVQVAFVTELGFLIRMFGEPSFVVPYSYDYYSNMDFLISLPQVEGYFIARTRCQNPELNSSSRVTGHLSISSRPYLSDEIINWNNSLDELPDCSIFQP
jgi:hypothetical protein